MYIITFSINYIKSPSDPRKSDVLRSVPEERYTIHKSNFPLGLLSPSRILYYLYLMHHRVSRAVCSKRAELLSTYRNLLLAYFLILKLIFHA